MQMIFKGRGLELLRTYQPPGIAVRGDLDAAQVGLLVSVVDRVAAESGGDVVLDCAGLEFAGVGALRGVLTAAGVLSEQGHRLRVRGLSPHYARIFPLAGWDRVPGLVLEGTTGQQPSTRNRAGPPE